MTFKLMHIVYLDSTTPNIIQRNKWMKIEGQADDPR